MPPKPLKQAWSHNAVKPPTPSRDVVSRLEQAALAQQRATPRYEMHLTPFGTLTRDVNRAVEARREARISHIAKRLARHQALARDGFNRDLYT